MPERISISFVADILGISARTMRHMAQRGELPGAAKIGRRWTFDEARIRAYVRRQEAATCQSARHLPDVSGVATPYGVAFRSAGETSSSRYARTIQRLRSGERAVACAYYGEQRHTFDVLEGWGKVIERQWIRLMAQGLPKLFGNGGRPTRSATPPSSAISWPSPACSTTPLLRAGWKPTRFSLACAWSRSGGTRSCCRTSRTSRWSSTERRTLPVPRSAPPSRRRLVADRPLDLRPAAAPRPREHQDDGDLSSVPDHGADPGSSSRRSCRKQPTPEQ